MFRCTAFILVGLLVSACVYGQARPEITLAPEHVPHFMVFDVFVDAGDQELAAYQFELKSSSERVQIVGVEGGAHEAFQAPPFYDSDALANNRIVIAAFSTNDELPTGRVRVARLHFVADDATTAPNFNTRLIVSASADGKEIPSTITIAELQGETK